MILILGQGRIFENTVEVGGAELKGGRMLGKKSSMNVYIIKLFHMLTVINEYFCRCI